MTQGGDCRSEIVDDGQIESVSDIASVKFHPNIIDLLMVLNVTFHFSQILSSRGLFSPLEMSVFGFSTAVEARQELFSYPDRLAAGALHTSTAVAGPDSSGDALRVVWFIIVAAKFIKTTFLSNLFIYQHTSRFGLRLIR